MSEENNQLQEVERKEYKIRCGDKTWDVRFTFKAWSYLEKKFGSIQKVMDVIRITPFTVLPSFIFAAIRKSDPELTEDKLADYMDDADLDELRQMLLVIKESMTSSLPIPPKKKEGDSEDPPPAE